MESIVAWVAHFAQKGAHYAESAPPQQDLPNGAGLCCSAGGFVWTRSWDLAESGERRSTGVEPRGVYLERQRIGKFCNAAGKLFTPRSRLRTGRPGESAGHPPGHTDESGGAAELGMRADPIPP